MTTLVTGAAGHIGATLTRALLDQGKDVRALVHRDRRALAGLDIEIVQGDVRDPRSVDRAVAGAEIVYHAAGHISLRTDDWEQCEAINVQGTRNVVQACLQRGVRRLIHFSSVHALEQEEGDAVVDESWPLVSAPDAPPYDRSKALGEQVVREAISAGLDAVILRPTGIIGPDDFKPSHTGLMLLALARGKLPALVRGGFDWVDVRDVAGAALRAAALAPAGGEYLLPGHWASLQELAQTVADMTGRRPPILVFPMKIARLGLALTGPLYRLNRHEPLFTEVSLRALRGGRHISHDRATRELGYRPRPLRDTIADTLRWFEARGELAFPNRPPL